MRVRTRILDQARHRAQAMRLEIGGAIRGARHAAGLRLSDVARAIGRSEPWLSRVERGTDSTVSIDEMVLLSAAVGLKLWITQYPAARALRDAPQLDLLRRFRARVGELWTWSYEVIVPIPRDQRAADAVIRRNLTVIMIEAFTRLSDAQSQLRAVLLKARDMGIGRVIVVVAATPTNRQALAAAAQLVAAEFPLGTRASLNALAQGRDPGANGIVLI